MSHVLSSIPDTLIAAMATGTSDAVGGKTPAVDGTIVAFTDPERQIIKQAEALKFKYAIFGVKGKDDKALLPDEVKDSISVRALPTPPSPAPRPSRHPHSPPVHI